MILEPRAQSVIVHKQMLISQMLLLKIKKKFLKVHTSSMGMCLSSPFGCSSVWLHLLNIPRFEVSAPRRASHYMFQDMVPAHGRAWLKQQDRLIYFILFFCAKAVSEREDRVATDGGIPRACCHAGTGSLNWENRVRGILKSLELDTPSFPGNKRGKTLARGREHVGGD